MIHFAWPLVFLLLPVPYVLRRLWPRTGGDTAAAVKVPFFYEVKALSLRERKARLFRSSFFTATAWLCLITAAARPQMPSGLQSYAVPVRDVLLIMDISGSMEQKDLLLKGHPAQRLDAVREAADRFIAGRRSDRIGIILFAEQANLYVPLTVDLSTLRTMLAGAEVGLLGGKTAIGDALGLAVSYLEKSGAEQKVAVLLTDGVNNAGSIMPADALKRAEDAGVTVYTIGVGTDADPQRGIDRPLLETIASRTGGLFFMVDNAPGLEEAYRLISAREPSSRASVYLTPQKELYPYPLFAFLCLATISVLRRFRETLRYMREKGHE